MKIKFFTVFLASVILIMPACNENDNADTSGDAAVLMTVTETMTAAESITDIETGTGIAGEFPVNSGNDETAGVSTAPAETVTENTGTEVNLPEEPDNKLTPNKLSASNPEYSEWFNIYSAVLTGENELGIDFFNHYAGTESDISTLEQFSGLGLYDINGNGTPELFIGIVLWEGIYYHVFTVSDGKAKYSGAVEGNAVEKSTGAVFSSADEAGYQPDMAYDFDGETISESDTEVITSYEHHDDGTSTAKVSLDGRTYDYRDSKEIAFIDMDASLVKAAYDYTGEKFEIDNIWHNDTVMPELAPLSEEFDLKIREDYTYSSNFDYGRDYSADDVVISRALGRYNGYYAVIITPSLHTDDIGEIYAADCIFTLPSGMSEIILFSEEPRLEGEKYYPGGYYNIEYAFLRNYIDVGDLHEIEYYVNR